MDFPPFQFQAPAAQCYVSAEVSVRVVSNVHAHINVQEHIHNEKGAVKFVQKSRHMIY